MTFTWQPSTKPRVITVLSRKKANSKNSKVPLTTIALINSLTAIGAVVVVVAPTQVSMLS